MRLTVNLHWCLTFMAFVLPGAASVPVEGLKGSSVTLPCCKNSGDDLSIVLTFGSETAYGRGQSEHFRGRVHKSGSCDLILQDLKTTDAGKYTADVYDKSGSISRNSFDVHVKVNLKGQKGEELMLDELPRVAKSVEHLTNPHWTEVWRRGKGALTDRLTYKNDRLTIKNFSSSDAGIYRVLNSSGGGILITLTLTDEISLKIGEELKLDVLLPNADKVQHQSRRSTEWMKIWSRTDGVQSERLTIRDGNLIINEFTARDAGSYRVLDFEGNILITVTVTESKHPSTESKNKLDSTDGDKTDDTEQVPVIYCIMSAGLVVFAALLVSTLVALTIQKHTHC